MSGGVVIRCEGSPEIGLGHVVRCLALARELRDRHARTVAFAIRGDSLGARLVRDAGFSVVRRPSGRVDRVDWLVGAIRTTDAAILVLDVRGELFLDDVRAIRDRTAVRVVVIDDPSEVRLASDEAFYPPVPQARGLAWPGFAGRVHIGWEWVLLRPEFAVEPRRSPHEPPVLLISMGGSDPAGLTRFAVRALADLRTRARCVVLLGPGFRHDAELVSLMESGPQDRVVIRDGDVRRQMVAADLAVLSFGVTAYEAAACALPAVHLCLTDDHVRASSAFADAGIAVSLGRADQVEGARLVEAVDDLLTDTAGRAAMAARARARVDGAGAARIAAVVAAGGWG